MSQNKGLLKNTFILSIVQVLNIIIKVLQNKIAAIVLGPSGVGIVGLFTNSMQFVTTGAGLGISQSAVRDIAAADAQGDIDTYNRIHTITNKIVYFTGLLGALIMLIASYPLSIYVFGDTSYTLGYCVLTSAVFFNIVSEGRLAILKGKRRFKDLAKCTITGSIVGFLIVVPIYWLFKDKGIVRALSLIALAQFVYVKIYTDKYKFSPIKMSVKEIFSGAASMIKMGVSLMIVTFITIVFNLLVASFIRRCGNLSDVGIYTAGSTILTSYFSVLISAMSTDFYPRVSAVYEDNKKLEDIVNTQCITCLSLLFPIVVIFVYAAPIFISILYTGEFVKASDYTDYAMIGTILIVCSNFLGIILLAKRKSKIFLSSVVFQRSFLLFVYYAFYNLWGVKGLGFAYIMTGLSDLILMTVIMAHYFNIKLGKIVYEFISLILLFTIMSMVFKTFENVYVKYSLGFILLSLSLVITYYVCKIKLEIDVIKFINNKLRRK